MHKVREELGFTSSCAGRSSENLCSSSGGAQKKRERQGETQEPSKLMVF
jgi:hypothetical protein